MNRSFRAPESQMHAALKQREQRFAGLRGSVMKEKEEELALFLEMKKREKERNDLLLNSSEEFDAALGSNAGTNPIFNISSSTTAPVRKTGVYDFLNSENDKNDDDCLGESIEDARNHQQREISLWERLGKAEMLDIESSSFSWDRLSSLHHTKHSSNNEHSEDEMNKALDVRIEHNLERIAFLSKAANTERPSAVTNSLFIGGALAARSTYTLKHLGITHILCLCANEIGQSDSQFHNLFTYKNFSVRDNEDSNISSIFEEACDFIDYVKQTGQSVLVHCFEGRSRSVTLVLAYLMLRKKFTLLEAWNALKRVHPRSQPNSGFAKILLELDQKLHGKVSMKWQWQQKPMMKICPICGKNVGLSNRSLKLHLEKSHT